MTDRLDIEELDDPSLTIHRVCDPRGMLLRLGFVRVKTVQRKWIYRLLIPLFNGGVPAQNGRRRISHVCMETLDIREPSEPNLDRRMFWCSEDELHFTIRFGYPSNNCRKDRIVLSFVDLVPKFQKNISRVRDSELVRFERIVTYLIDELKNKALSTVTNLHGDSITPSDALERALHDVLECSWKTDKERETVFGDLWIADTSEPSKPSDVYPPPRKSRNRSRLPSFRYCW